MSYTLPAGKKVYFASDFHLGLPNYQSSIAREKLICQWLDEIKKDAFKIYLVGDLFDVWFEYKNVIPKGYTRFLGKLAELSDAGILIEIFTGNHDLWMKDYFSKELNIPIHFKPIEVEINKVSFYIGHGDGLGPGDKSYKILKSIMTSKWAQWLYKRLHPDTGITLATYFSKRGEHKKETENTYQGDDKEWLVMYAEAYNAHTPTDYFIFGHRHLAMSKSIGNNSTYINLGDWLQYNSYAVFDGEICTLKYYENYNID